MNRIYVVVLLFLGFTAISTPASAQAITGVCISNTFTCGYYAFGQYNSIYGTNMPAYQPSSGSLQTFVRMCSNASCLFQNDHYANTEPNPAYWYVSSTQVNFYGVNTATSNGGLYLGVCGGGICTPLFGKLPIY